MHRSLSLLSLLSITKRIHNAGRVMGEPTGLALSCSISNGRLVALCSNLQSTNLPTSAIWAAQPHSISRAQTEAQTPALPWHSHRAWSAHHQLPRPGQGRGDRIATATPHLALPATNNQTQASGNTGTHWRGDYWTDKKKLNNMCSHRDLIQL